MTWFVSEKDVWCLSHPVPLDDAPNPTTFGILVVAGGNPWVPEWMTAPAQIAGWLMNLADPSSVFLAVQCLDDGTNTRQN